MPELQLGLIEARFADLIWANAPVTTSALVKLAEAELHWKRTTTHTVIPVSYTHLTLPTTIRV